MKFSLWANTNIFVQSSDDLNRLVCNGNQFRTWWTAMGTSAVPRKLTIQDNTKNCETHEAVYTQGVVLRWRAVGSKRQ